MVSNIFINENLRFLPHFKGTFSSNNIPKINSKDSRAYFIINLDTNEEPGSHFVYFEGGCYMKMQQ